MNEEEGRGEVIEVSRETIATLAAQAASDVEGVFVSQQKAVDSLTSRMKREFVHKGVKVEEADGSYSLSLGLRVSFGSDLPSLAREVRDKVRGYVEGLTGVQVEEIEIIIEDVELPGERDQDSSPAG